MTATRRCNTWNGQHALIVTCRRPWRRLFHLERAITCWHCSLRIPEP